jgi:hypothetical protein
MQEASEANQGPVLRSRLGPASATLWKVDDRTDRRTHDMKADANVGELLRRAIPKASVFALAWSQSGWKSILSFGSRAFHSCWFSADVVRSKC